MNYLLKRQPSSGGMVECLLNNSKRSNSKYCCCRNGLRPSHPVCWINVPQCRTSTYYSALKMKLEKKKISKSENVSVKKDPVYNSKKLTDLFKMMPPKVPKVVIKRKLSQSSEHKIKGKLNIDCTNSYDPNMLDSYLELESPRGLQLLQRDIVSIRRLTLKNQCETFAYSNKHMTANGNINFQDWIDIQRSLRGSVKTSLLLPPRQRKIYYIEHDNNSGADVRENKYLRKSLHNMSISEKLKVLNKASLVSPSKPRIFPENCDIDSKIHDVRESYKNLGRPSYDEKLDKLIKQSSIAQRRIKRGVEEPKTVQEQHEKPDRKSDRFTVPMSRDFSSLQFLYSSLDICLTNGMVKEAFELIRKQRRKPKWYQVMSKKYKIIPEIYNSLLYALSSKGHWDLLKTVISWMESDGVELNCDSFAAQLQCLAEVRETGSEDFVLKEVRKVLNSIFLRNISLNDIFCKTILSRNASEKVLAIVREVVPAFEIQPVIMELSSACPLLKNLHVGRNALQPQIDSIGAAEMERLVEEQLRIERNLRLDVKAAASGLNSENVPAKQKLKIENLRLHWRAALTRAVRALQEVHMKEFPNSRALFNLSIHLNCVPVHRIVDILMEKTENLIRYSGGYGPSCHEYRRAIGCKIFQCYQLRKKDEIGYTDKTKNLFKKYVSWFANPTGPAMNSRQKWQMIIQDSEKSGLLDIHVVPWPEGVILKLGQVLLKTIINEVKFCMKTTSGVSHFPVLYTILRYRNHGFYEEIKCHPSVSLLFSRVGFDVLHFNSDQIPMVCPPKPWKSPHHGGYLFLPTDFIRHPGGITGKMSNLKDLPVQQLYATFDSLNALQSVPWTINEDVLDVALNVFRSGGSEKLGVPRYPKEPSFKETLKGLSFEDHLKYKKEKIKVLRELANNYGLWCEALYRLSLADHFRKKVFWLPQNCDFRGRVYPVPALINHLGSDLYRSLFCFAKAKPLGPRGLDWLKIHLVNVTGSHKRKPVKERLDFANEILPIIMDSAENPLTGEKWWMKSEEPWQTLACCMEVRKAISSPNPEAYLCRFPIHQDGSCNGLQHYAALGKDLIGARSVNLVPCQNPQDVYSVVAELVEKERAKDASNGIEVAKILEGFVERKVIKQTVMTTVYGVTIYGAKLQIKKRLEELPNFPTEYINAAGAYLTEKTFLSLKKMFSSAKEIQEWFLRCATEICEIEDYVQWMSPLGLPVVQSYAKFSQHRVSKERYLKPDTLKQKNAFPPNFIHSLDSCHMMLTSLYCEQAGLTFAAVHDCFWTHPYTVDTMNRICREQFIALHSEKILEDLSEFFKRTYVGGKNSQEAKKVFESLPEKGSFDIKEVLNSVYFFS